MLPKEICDNNKIEEQFAGLHILGWSVTTPLPQKKQKESIFTVKILHVFII